ncbi:bifunctional riboflavin kinase/FAD synthetase [Proteiniborus sp. MB09-C3]|uniref:bifunctional riboflavin kinase/FAD synthetase n=1 Tax=Proteiniborus sp. MB09-C3 TaxID=3050072 RepID=UPI00255345D6|nr:bifunctional riboflavin kinase/FAD synthetase [Proteiniborus sp. MB09-C3]WIV10906.1 bifunctional riboflavin kinase/FAD synthetase [Proteiniborus sp. MB09-C3]
MKILLDTRTNVKENTAVALGNFDGLHLGHQYLIEEMKKKANEKGLTKSVFTFNNDSLVQFKTNKTNNILTSNEQKVLLFESIGIELLYLVDFTEDLMHMSPYEFVRNILVEKLRTKLVVIGFDHRFGYKAQGDGEFLIKAGNEFGFEVMIIESITKNNKIISSSYIRKLIRDGLIKEANTLLGRPFAICGTIVKGKGRGKGLGFATANLKMDTDYQIPKFGVYKSFTYIDGKEYLSITNIGSNPTFNDVGFSIETHIIDFDENIYDKKIEIQLVDFIRKEKKFSSKDELKKQVMKDIHEITSNSD